jgi:hypothetical protein
MPPCGLEPLIDTVGENLIYARIGRIRPLGHHGPLLLLVHYFTKLYAFYNIKFPKLTSEMQMSFLNEAPGSPMYSEFYRRDPE